MTFMRRLTTFAALAGIASLSLTSCGMTQPPLCVQAAELRQAVRQLQDASVSEDGLGSLTIAVTQVRTEFDQFRTAAKNQFAPQVNAVTSSMDQLQAKVFTAKADPSAAALGQVGVALGGLQTSVEDLWQGLSGTC